MPKKAKEKSALEVRSLSRPGRHAVGGVSGLLLNIKDTGARSWILRVRIGNMRRNFALGPFPDVTLEQARNKARLIRSQLEEGLDPLILKREAKAKLITEQLKGITFAECARLYYQQKESEFSEKHSKDWFSALERHAFPIIGNIPIASIEMVHVMAVLNPIWIEKTETATRVRQRIEAVINWATVNGYRSGENPARWKGHLEAALPKPSKVRIVEHFPAIPWKQIGSFMHELRQRQGMGARALEFIILTAARSREVRLATWEQIDFDTRTWIIPRENVKNRLEHRIPLSSQAVKLLFTLTLNFSEVTEVTEVIFPESLENSGNVNGCHKVSESYLLEIIKKRGLRGIIFPGAKIGNSLSDASISKVCRAMGVDAVPHGFRSTFRDWCAEYTNIPREIAEMALGHTIQNKVEAAYRRGDLFEKRRELMQDWGNYCDSVEAVEVTGGEVAQ